MIDFNLKATTLYKITDPEQCEDGTGCNDDNLSLDTMERNPYFPGACMFCGCAINEN